MDILGDVLWTHCTAWTWESQDFLGVVLGWRDSLYVCFVSWQVLSVPENKQWQSRSKLPVEPSGHLTSGGFELDLIIWSIISENERWIYSYDVFSTVSVRSSAPLFHNWAHFHWHHHTQQRTSAFINYKCASEQRMPRERVQLVIVL